MAVFLPSSRKSLYVRLVIPRQLQHHFKHRRELWRTLATLDRSEASWKAVTIEARVRRVFHLLSRNGHRMNQEQIEALVETWLNGAIDEAAMFPPEIFPTVSLNQNRSWYVLF
jgi:hypothetical protein